LDPPFGAMPNAWVAEELTSEASAAGSTTITTSTRTQHDQNGNTTSEFVYDYAGYAALHSSGNPLYGSTSVGAALHTVGRTMKYSVPDSTTNTASANIYTESGASTLFQLPASVIDGSLQTATFVYDNTGNLTSET